MNSDARDVPPLDLGRWYYRYGYVAVARFLSGVSPDTLAATRHECSPHRAMHLRSTPRRRLFHARSRRRVLPVGMASVARATRSRGADAHRCVARPHHGARRAGTSHGQAPRRNHRPIGTCVPGGSQARRATADHTPAAAVRRAPRRATTGCAGATGSALRASHCSRVLLSFRSRSSAASRRIPDGRGANRRSGARCRSPRGSTSRWAPRSGFRDRKRTRTTSTPCGAFTSARGAPRSRCTTRSSSSDVERPRSLVCERDVGANARCQRLAPEPLQLRRNVHAGARLSRARARLG